MSNATKTHGQQLLRQLKTRQDAIAAEIGFSQPQISRWRAGSRKPSAAARRALEEHFSIPSGAWDRMPVADGQPPAGISAPTAPSPAPTSANPAVPPPPPAGYEPPPTNAQIADEPEPFEPPDFAHYGTTTRELRESCARLRAAIDRATNPAPGAPPADAATIAKLEKQYQTALFMLGKAQGEISPADQRTLCKSPTFYRVVGELRDALVEALEAEFPGDAGRKRRSAVLDRFAATFYAKWGPAEDTDDR